MKRIKDLTIHRRYEVFWDDSSSTSGWQEEGAYGTSSCQSLGYLVDSNPTFLALVQSMERDGLIADVLSIPWSVIREVIEWKCQDS
mgnify:CR=1 FL=1